ncbi:MAG: sigma-54-dependent Fis family transcriptional regulator [Nitrososphaera sp.]
MAATNKDLREMVRTGKFREDLFYRINTITLQIPPLRDRADDVPVLVDHFLNLAVIEQARRPFFTEQAMSVLMSYNWPGNVRELKNLVERYCIVSPAARIEKSHLPVEILNYKAMAESQQMNSKLNREYLLTMLQASNWNKSRVSRQTGIPLSTLCRILKRLNLSKPR